MRLGLLGGTFDPIHNGHLDAAEAARSALGLDEVWLIPASVPPHRPDPPLASPWHRFAMVALAVDGREGLCASDLELRTPGRSYTWETLQQLHRLGYNPLQLFFIAGADAIAKLATWSNYPALLDACHFVGVTRPGRSMTHLADELREARDRFVWVGAGARDVARTHPETKGAGQVCRIWLVEAATTNVSATDVRQRAARGARIDDLVPAPVARHVQRHHLYDSPSDAAGPLHDTK